MGMVIESQIVFDIDIVQAYINFSNSIPIQYKNGKKLDCILAFINLYKSLIQQHFLTTLATLIIQTCIGERSCTQNLLFKQTLFKILY